MPSDRSPTPAQLLDIEKLIDARGGVLGLFAQVEWFLAKLLLEAQHYPAYASIDLSFSEHVEKRAQKVRTLLSAEGPYTPYCHDLLTALDKVMEFHELRNFSAHGVLIHQYREGVFHLHFRMYRMFKGGDLKEGFKHYTLPSYLEEVRQLGSSARQFVKAVHKLASDLGLQNVEAEF